MSGHSKWATIKRQKGANDVKRGALFTKLSKTVSIAVLQGGGVGDPTQNFRLRLAVDAARAANMPKENIQRAIDRVTGKSAEAIEEVVYEGFGPGGFTVIVEAATNNKNRTAGEIQNVFNKNGGNMGQPGSVAYQFAQKGQIVLVQQGKSVDDIFLDAADAGAEDIVEAGGEIILYTSSSDLAKVRDSLMAKGYTISEMELLRMATTPISVDDATGERAMEFVEKLEDLEDVQKVYTNIA